MSTLEVACGRCDRRFRVRAEFAGRSTRCPGCSAPITVAGAAKSAPAPRAEPEERPAPRPRRRDADDEPRRLSADWDPVEMAFRREQVAVVCVLLAILLDYLMFCLMRSAGGAGDGLIGLVMIVLAGPTLTAGAFGLMARLSAQRAPPETLSKGSATASLLCALAALASVVILAFTMLMSRDSNQPMEAPMAVSIGGLILSVLGAAGTFLGFTAQVGIARRSAAISRGIGRTAVAVCSCVLGLIGIGVLYALINEVAFPPAYYPGAYDPHEDFYQITLGVLLPLALAVVLVLYHRLLAAGRRALQGEPSWRYDG